MKIQGESEVFVRNVFTLQQCAPIVGSKVHSFKNEYAMLCAWRDFVQEVDPDIITGYNIVNFDLPFIIDRSSHLMNNGDFAKFSRIKGKISKIK